MDWRKTNKVIHRDLGYLFVFLTIIYAISGIAFNHLGEWNSNFIIEKQEINNLNLSASKAGFDEEILKSELKRIDQYHNYLMVDFPSESKIKVYFKNGSLLYDLNSKEGELERVSKRPLLYEINYFHRNPGGLWVWISDIFALSLITLAITGLFLSKGKNGFQGRGKWLVSIGTITTIFFMFLLFN